MPKMTTTQIKRIKITKLRIALSNIQKELKVIEDNDILTNGNIIKKFKDIDGEFITQKLLKLIELALFEPSTQKLIKHYPPSIFKDVTKQNNKSGAYKRYYSKRYVTDANIHSREHRDKLYKIIDGLTSVDRRWDDMVDYDIVTCIGAQASMLNRLANKIDKELKDSLKLSV